MGVEGEEILRRRGIKEQGVYKKGAEDLGSWRDSLVSQITNVHGASIGCIIHGVLCTMKT